MKSTCKIIVKKDPKILNASFKYKMTTKRWKKRGVSSLEHELKPFTLVMDLGRKCVLEG